MKNKIFWFAFILTLVNQLYSQQNKIIVKKNQHLIFNQSISFNPNIERYYRVLECKLGSSYSKLQLEKIQLRLIQNFSGAKLIQSDSESKIVFITNKMTLLPTNGSIQEYIKSILVELNLYNGFIEIKEYNLELE
jgi:hypothetical protein